MTVPDHSLLYPEFELSLKTEVTELNNRWINHLVSVTKKENLSEIFVTDGFYPYYSVQKVKILFIGREALEIGGNNYQEILYSAFLDNIIGTKTLNGHRFHSTMLYIAYALEKQIYEWHKIPYASEFINEFAKKDGISYAFMNLSKFSNESGDWFADNELINKFIEYSLVSEENYFGSEIDLLNPDIIIGMNFEGRADCLGTFSAHRHFYGGNNDVAVSRLKTQSGKEYIYFDTWHFSAPGKSPSRDIFYPLMYALMDQSII